MLLLQTITYGLQQP